MAKQSETPQPTLKRNDWTSATVHAAAMDVAQAAGLKPNECEAFARNTVRFWELGNPTVVTHNYAKK